MELYHGSPFLIERPDLSFAKSFRDFGPGFYLAEDEIDAVTIAIKNTWSGYLHIYEVDEDAVFSTLSIVEFDGFDDDWFRFVYDNRMGRDPSMDYDIAIGPTAGGKVNDIFDACRKSNTPYRSIEKRLKSEIANTHFGMQWCLATQEAIDCLELVDVEQITAD